MKNKKILLIFIVIGIISFAIFISIVFYVLNSVSISPPQDKKFGKEELEGEEPEKIIEILNLKDKVPYYGKSFSITFNQSEGLFYFYIDPDNNEQGEREMDEFLKLNGIPSRSLFPGLEKTINPIP